ncbi:hypothetical protein LY78DRAFT_658437 [Colletotrichum sublineola]|nr:hypothetical protein LY78DRAFT_658437 [Colletotrichum sublineola]
MAQRARGMVTARLLGFLRTACPLLPNPRFLPFLSTPQQSILSPTVSLMYSVSTTVSALHRLARLYSHFALIT